MLIVIRAGRDRKEHKELKERVRVLEADVDALKAQVSELQGEMDGHEHAEEFPAYEELDGRLNSMDCWKADRHHRHPEYATREDTVAAAPE
jgi:hypothetical protein